MILPRKTPATQACYRIHTWNARLLLECQFIRALFHSAFSFSFFIQLFLSVFYSFFPVLNFHRSPSRARMPRTDKQQDKDNKQKDISSELIHSLLPVCMSTVLG